MKPSSWMITVIMMLFNISLPTHAEQQKLKRKTNNVASDPSQQENYIITHYGLEYYTPVTESSPSIQVHNDGYFTAEVIPVDPKTGEELKTINNLYVPLHTGYSIGTNDHQQAQSQQHVVANDKKTTTKIRENDHQSQSTNSAKHSPPTSKYKFDKKYKYKNADAAKKNSTMRVTSLGVGVGVSPSASDDGKNKINVDDTNKRIKQISAIADTEKFSAK